MKQPLIVLTGPTAVGKSSLSIALAKQMKGEIISADSMQVYRYMDIGSAKIKECEMDGVPHHLINVLDPTEDFNVALFQNLCFKAMEEIYKRGNIPILVGGTGFYIQSVLYNIDFTETQIDDSYRKELEQIALTKGNHYLHSMLAEVDLISAQNIHPNNIKKVIRALEFFKQTKQPISTHNEVERNKTSPYQFAYFVLNTERQLLYQKIDQRVDQMIIDGLVEEVYGLLEMGCHRQLVSMQGLGYKEMIAYLEGELTLEEAVYLIKRDTRHFAKRQLTWFRREKEIIWIDKNEKSDNASILQRMLEILKEKEVI